ncbi:12297_t:CDS:2, partial [Ambispora gerdemannii]
MSSLPSKPLSSTEAAIASRTQRGQVKTLKATILDLNKEVSDLKQKLEISENKNKYLLESSKKAEQYLNNYIKVAEAALAAKDIIISDIVK